MTKLAIILKTLLLAAALTGSYIYGINFAAGQALESFKIDHTITCIKWGANIDVKDSAGYTALALTSQSPDDLPETKWILAHGADVNAGAASGNNPLMQMVDYYDDHPGELEIADCLIRAGAHIDDTDNNGHTALAAACLRGKPVLAGWLIRHGANVNPNGEAQNRPLWCAFQCAEVPVSTTDDATASLIRVLLDHGASANGRLPDKTFPLFEALPYPKIVAVLMDHGARVDMTDDYGFTPIQEAANHGYSDDIPILIAHHASPNATNFLGETPLAVARCIGDTGTVSDYKATYHALLKAGANPNSPSVPVTTTDGP